MAADLGWSLPRAPCSRRLVQDLPCQSLGGSCQEKLDVLNLAPRLALRDDQPHQQLEKVHRLAPGWDPWSVMEMLLLTSTHLCDPPASLLDPLALPSSVPMHGTFV